MGAVVATDNLGQSAHRGRVTHANNLPIILMFWNWFSPCDEHFRRLHSGDLQCYRTMNVIAGCQSGLGRPAELTLAGLPNSRHKRVGTIGRACHTVVRQECSVLSYPRS